MTTLPDGRRIREFRVDVPESQLDDLRDRLDRTRWPEPETVDGWSQGLPLADARELCGYWASEYDWRRCEAELNALPQFRTVLDGGGDHPADPVDIHFVHVRSPHPGAVPLLLTHGWPGSVVEFLDVVAALVDPPDAADAFDVVAPSLPGYGFSERPSAAGWGVDRIASAWAQLMQRLGYDRYVAQGGDWGSLVTSALGAQAPSGLAGIHLTMPLAPRPPEGEVPALTGAETAALAQRRSWVKTGTGYASVQSTRPQTMGYGLVDSPVALCTWIAEKFCESTAGHPEDAISRDRLLDDVMLYWLPGTGASSARLYWESYHSARHDIVKVPTGVTLFPREIARLPRSWLERRYVDLRYWSEPGAGGHFASLEVPEIWIHEVRSAFRALR